MSFGRQTFCAAVHAAVFFQEQILLGRRANTGYYDGYYAFPAGHVEKFETLPEALFRELQEETGITPIFNSIVEPCLTVEHLRDYGAHFESRFVHAFEHTFIIDAWTGLPLNKEEDKCSELRFFSLADLPSPLMPLTQHMLETIRTPNAPRLTQFGWDNSAFKKRPHPSV